MDTEQTNKVFDAIEKLLEDYGRSPERAEPTGRGFYTDFYAAQARAVKHVAWMIQEARKFIASAEEGSENFQKAQRWLGFMQGALWAVGAASIDDFRVMNMLAEPFTTEKIVGFTRIKTGRTQTAAPNESNAPKEGNDDDAGR